MTSVPVGSAPGDTKGAPSKETLDDKAVFDRLFVKSIHEKFVLGLDKKTDTFEYHASEHLKMSAVYWGCMAMELVGSLHKMDKKGIIDFVFKCKHPNGGFGGNIGHDPHLLYTLSAVQILALFDSLDKIDAVKVASYVKGLQQRDGSFVGDEWGEIDTRFSYCALNCLAIIGKLDCVDVKAATQFVAKCRNFDGGFGALPGAESHAGQIFCCVGALAIGNAMHEIDSDILGWWLCERQLPTGGLNGRPEKKQDVCYSWWVLSSLSMLGKIRWIDRMKLGQYIMSCQDVEDGGFSDRPGNVADVFHCYFGIAGLSLLGFGNLSPIDPVFALPVSVCNRLKLPQRFSTK